MALRKTGYSQTTADNYLINAATVFTGVKYTAEEGFTGEIHGATSGGVTLTIEQTYRDIEVDGTGHMKLKNNKILEAATATVTANVKEITAEAIRRSLNGIIADVAAAEGPEGYKVIRTKRMLEDSDYLENIAIAGTLSGTNEPVIAILDNALCTSGLELGTEDNNEAVIEQTYEAHASVEQLDRDEFPWRILYPDTSGTTEPTDGTTIDTTGTEVTEQ